MYAIALDKNKTKFLSSEDEEVELSKGPLLFNTREESELYISKYVIPGITRSVKVLIGFKYIQKIEKVDKEFVQRYRNIEQYAFSRSAILSSNIKIVDEFYELEPTYS